ncbi:MAG: helix-hairpin-helix domain-containing protein [Alistipes sp.]|nr:helix-hairpin-helix domain-containing protein [Alistipes sp.]
MELLKKSHIRALAVLVPVVLLLLLACYFAERRPSEFDGGALAAEWETASEEVSLHEFDPNTADVFELCALGLTRMQAVSVVKYRAAGKVYRIKEDLLTVYAMTDSLYRVLEPYIVIGDEYRLPRRGFERRTDFCAERERLHLRPMRMDTVRGEHLREMLGFTVRQAEAYDAYVRRRDGIRSMEELRECYLLCDLADTLAPFVSFAERAAADPYLRPVELNTADSAALRSIDGIGERSVAAIMEYRRRLGGFVSAAQLAEIPQVTESNYEKILKQICCDSCEIRKIDINFAAPEELGAHPYIGARTLRRILKQRQLKGGWNAIEEMTEDNILTQSDAARLAPYLRFSVEQK